MMQVLYRKQFLFKMQQNVQYSKYYTQQSDYFETDAIFQIWYLEIKLLWNWCREGWEVWEVWRGRFQVSFENQSNLIKSIKS